MDQTLTRAGRLPICLRHGLLISTPLAAHLSGINFRIQAADFPLARSLTLVCPVLAKHTWQGKALVRREQKLLSVYPAIGNFIGRVGPRVADCAEKGNCAPANEVSGNTPSVPVAGSSHVSKSLGKNPMLGWSQLKSR